jgi:hypothetical protein
MDQLKFVMSKEPKTYGTTGFFHYDINLFLHCESKYIGINSQKAEKIGVHYGCEANILMLIMKIFAFN